MGTQALNAQRYPAFTFAPEDLILDLPSTDPLFDPRVERIPVVAEDVLQLVTNGCPPIEVRRTDAGSVPIEGKQRTKAALVANALGADVEYAGPVESVRQAITALRQDEKLVKFVSKRMKGKPIRLRAVASNSGELADARLRMQARNLFRHDDALKETKAWCREQSETYGTAIADIALAVHKTEATVRAWLRSGTPTARKERKESGRPKTKEVASFLAEMEKGERDGDSFTALDVVKWVLGMGPRP